MNILGGLDRPSGGAYHFEGDDVGHFTDDELAAFRRRRIGFVFQSFQLLPRLTAQQNVELPMVYGGVPGAERRARATELLERVGLGARKGHRPTQLSGGQQQRVAIARALANRPDLLLADEPTGALDTRTAEEILEILRALHRDGSTVVLVTHDRDVGAVAERIIHITDGQTNDGVA
jgi:putative ABC transport system ATP-binding protein